MTGWVYFSGGAVAGESLIMAAAPFALSFIAGVRLLRHGPNALRLAYVTQAIQIPIVILPALTWKFVGGLIASVTLTLEGTHLFAGLEATWFLGSGPLGGLPAALGVNAAPIIVIFLLARSSDESETQQPNELAEQEA
jgi:hypothetical protein